MWIRLSTGSKSHKSECGGLGVAESRFMEDLWKIIIGMDRATVDNAGTPRPSPWCWPSGNSHCLLWLAKFVGLQTGRSRELLTPFYSCS
mmetsp:Transcript_47408/g.74089  ORF Transcript_47408/g.74089 Transcript_47408/m.74089 type:complete len:89 (+) Transcript_47408:1050-1316(+)